METTDKHGDLSVIISRRPGRSLSIRVLPDGRLRVSAPFGVSNRQVSRFIAQKESWIKRRQAEYERLYNFLARPQIAPGIKVQIVSSAELSVSEPTPGHIVVAKPKAASSWQIYSEARPLIKQRMNSLAKLQLPDKIRVMADEQGIKYSSLSIKYLRSRWGSCNAQGKVCLNSQLIRLPEELQGYVIAHELAHVKVPNHSQKFHSELLKIRPDAPALRRRLKAFSLMH